MPQLCWSTTPRNKPVHLPLAPEPHLPTWQGYIAEAASRGVWPTLQARLPPFWFPVREGISQTETYRAATRRGEYPHDSIGLALRCQEKLRLWVQDSLAGPIPVLCTSERSDFVTLVQALSCRNEPEAVPDSMGACLVTGFNNWDRINQIRDRWLADGHPAETWVAEFRRIIPQKELYQDRFLILAEGPYSNVSALDMGLPADEWLRVSLIIRLAHECSHYLALRLFNTVHDQPVDEVVADYVGIAAACGRFRADWFLRFFGLEEFPNYRQGGRLENYRGQPPLSDSAFRLLQALVHAAALNLECFDAQYFAGSRQGQDRGSLVPVLAKLTLEELASAAFFERLKE